MSRTVSAIAAVGIAMSVAACSSSGAHRGARNHGLTGTWTITSCQVDVSYIDDTNAVDNYVPDTEANFRQHFAENKVIGAASLAVVITLVNNTGGSASLPTGLVVSFTDRSGNDVGDPQTVNDANGTGYGPAVVNGHGSGETFSAGTLFKQGERVAESPDIGASMPQQPDLSCHVGRQ